MDKTKEVNHWWNSNPFTYNSNVGIGKITEIKEMGIPFFDSMEERYKKHSGGSTQQPDRPVFSKFIDYSSLQGKRVLDIAVGTGFSTVAFAEARAEVTGIDLTEFAVEATKKNLQLRGLSGTIKQMDAQKLDFPDNSFDFVCAHGCLMHMPNTDQAVAEIYRVLKPGGQTYAWMYHRGWHYWFAIMFLRGLLLGGFFNYGFSSLAMTSRFSDGAHQGGNPHTKFYSRKGFRKLFKRGNFEEVKVYSNYNPNEWNAWPLRSISLGKFVPKRMQRFLSEQAGFAYACSITAVKKPE